MTVRANKPAFNIREKLKELTQSIGLKGRELMRAATVQEARDLVSAGRRNLVINGACQIHQRGGTSTALIDSYPVDRFVINSAGLDQYAANFSQSAESPDGFSNSLRIEGTTPETAIGNGEYLRLQHRIEAQNLQHLGFGSSSAKSITVSFWVKSSIPGAYAFHIWQADTNEIVNSRYHINTADTWEYKTFTYSGNTGGAINNDNGTGLTLNWILDANTTFTAESGLGANWDTYNYGNHFAAGHTANFCGSNNNFYLTGVQLEVGKNATEFEHRSYGEELALCERYFQKYGYGSLMWASARSPQNTYTEYTYGSFRFRTAMRDTASIGVIGSNFAGIRYNGSGYDIRNIALTLNSGAGQVGTEYSGRESCTVRILWPTDWTANDLVNVVVTNADSALTFEAEL